MATSPSAKNLGVNNQIESPQYADYSGGLNVKDFWHTIADNEMTIAQNIRLDQGGVVQMRSSWTLLTANPVPTTGNLIGLAHPSWLVSGVLTRYVVATDGTDVYWLNGTTWTKITGSVSLTPVASTLVSFQSMSNYLIGYDGLNDPWTWDGQASAILLLGGTPPIGNISALWQNYLFVAGVGTARARLYFSDLGDPATWPAINFIDVPSPYDGDPITGLAILYGNLIVFKRNSIYIITGTDPTTFVVSKMNSAVGCVSPYSVVSVDDLVYFVSDKGLYALNLSNETQVCYKVQPRYDSAVVNQLINGNRNQIQGLNYRLRNEIWELIDGTANGQNQHDRTLAHNYKVVDKNGDPAVTEHTRANAVTAPSVMADYYSGSIIPMASFYDKYVYLFNGGLAADAVGGGANANIPLSLMTGYKSLGVPNVTKTLRNMWTSLYQSGGTPKVTIGVLGNDFSTETVATLTPGSPSTFYNVKQPCGQIFGSSPQGKYFKYGFSSSDGGAFSLFQVAFDYIWNGLRR